MRVQSGRVEKCAGGAGMGRVVVRLGSFKGGNNSMPYKRKPVIEY